MMGINVKHAFGSALMMSTFIFVTGCTHKVQIIPSDKPIIINLNVKIDQEIRVRLDKDVEDLLANNPDIF